MQESNDDIKQILPGVPPMDVLGSSLERIYAPLLPENAGLEEMYALLEAVLTRPVGEEEALHGQSLALEALFHNLIHKSVGGQNDCGDAMPDYLNADHLKLALTVQNQTRRTIDTLSRVKKRKKFRKQSDKS